MPHAKCILHSPFFITALGDRNAPRKTRNGPTRQAEEAAWAGEGLLRQQEQAVSRRERVGRYRAEVRVRRPPPEEARLPPPVGRANQCRGARARADVRPDDPRPEERRRDA